MMEGVGYGEELVYKEVRVVGCCEVSGAEKVLIVWREVAVRACKLCNWDRKCSGCRKETFSASKI